VDFRVVSRRAWLFIWTLEKKELLRPSLTRERDVDIYRKLPLDTASRNLTPFWREQLVLYMNISICIFTVHDQNKKHSVSNKKQVITL